MWVKFDDQTPNDPDVDRLSDGAFRLWFAAICYSQSELTDGYVEAIRVRRLTPNYKASHLRELVDSGMFIPAGEGYVVRNFAKWNKTGEYWKAKRKADAERLAEWRQKQEVQRNV